MTGEPERTYRWVRRWAPLLVRRAVAVPEVRDLVSGFVAVRLVSLRNAIKLAGDRLLTTDGWAANAELIEVLSDALGVPRRAVSIIVGERSRRKTVLIRGVTANEIAKKIT